jgi:hypothetical protein
LNANRRFGVTAGCLDKQTRFLPNFAYMKTTTLPSKDSINRSSCPLALLLVPLALTSFALSPIAQAVTPAPDGGYPHQNTAEGEDALFSLTTGVSNTAIGFEALFSNTIGSYNTANGIAALYNNTVSDNTAAGAYALYSDTTGDDNTATGFDALYFNTVGRSNTGIGHDALLNNTTGTNNIGIGDAAGSNLTTGSNNINIGSTGSGGESNTIRIGVQGTQTATFIAGVSGTPIAGATGVAVSSSGQLGVRPSSARYKEAIQPMDNASEVILALKPVTFRYKKELDPRGIPQFGLVAEEVEKVNPDLVARDEQGKPYTVRYEAVNAMLLNEFLKARRQIDAQQKQIDALTAGLQKVSAQLELSKAAPQKVVSN